MAGEKNEVKKRSRTLVLVILNELTFEATKFETRTMPTPDMKAKEMIYWIRVETTDRRLVTDLQRFLGGSAQFIQLKVPSAFISVQAELESHRASRLPNRVGPGHSSASSSQQEQQQQDTEARYSVEIILRRQIRESKTGQTQAPYG